MSTSIFMGHLPMIEFVFQSDTSNPTQVYRLTTGLVRAGPAQIENAMATRRDNCRDPLPGDQRQKPSAQGE